jgi:hypothetical protein
MQSRLPVGDLYSSRAPDKSLLPKSMNCTILPVSESADKRSIIHDEYGSQNENSFGRLCEKKSGVDIERFRAEA